MNGKTESVDIYREKALAVYKLLLRKLSTGTIEELRKIIIDKEITQMLVFELSNEKHKLN